MGLDMYAYTTTQKPPREVDFAADSERELHYWCKHPNLHGWMEDLYFGKGGEQSFNCVNLLLTAEDLDELEIAICGGELPPTSGFFFGASDGEEAEDDLQFISKAREAIAAGLHVFYTSWW